MLSEEGAQQGDPLGPLLFCLAIHDLLSPLQSELILGYLDDVTLDGDINTVVKDFMDLETQAANIGLKLNRAKCEIIAPSAGSSALLASQGIIIQETEMSKVVLLGSPLFPEVTVDSVLAMKR